MYSGQTSASNVDNTVDNKSLITNNNNNNNHNNHYIANNFKLSNNNNNNNNHDELGNEYHLQQQHEQQQQQENNFNLIERKPKLNDRIEWSRDKILGFIEDYRRERVLWDPNCRGYHIKQIKYEALKELGLKYGAEIRAIRSKIKSLRSSFHREHGKVINGQRKGVHYQPVWFAYEAIRFILDENLTTTPAATTTTTNTTMINQQQLLQQQQQQQQQLMKQETLSSLLNASREILQNCALQTTATSTPTTTNTMTTTTTTTSSYCSSQNSDTLKITAPNISSTYITNCNNNNNNNNINHHNWSLATTTTTTNPFQPKSELQITKNDYSSNSDNYSNNNSDADADAEAVDRVAFFTAAAMAAVTAAVASAGTSARTDPNTPTNFFDNPPTPHNGWILRAEDIKTELLSNDDDMNAVMTTPTSSTTTTNDVNNKNCENATTAKLKQRICNNFRKRKHVDASTSTTPTTSTTKKSQQQQQRSNKINKNQLKLPSIKYMDSSSQTDAPTPALENGTTTTNTANNADEHGIFGDYVAITIRKLKTAKAKIVVKHIINNVLYEAEMGKYDLGMPATTDPPQLYKM